ncbi:MAG: P-loop NTPase [Kiritimatiellae bacterium]|nr:P-loop NTPase [Kiritimatiellia bacterium]
MEPTRRTQILAVGGGKGGVGKSCISANLAIALASSGHNTIIIDLDLGGANLHTLLGIQTTHLGIGDFIYRPDTQSLIEYAIDTGTDNLRLISGNGFIPGIANLEYQRKIKVLKAISQLDATYVVLDLGAGTSFNVVDFFTMTHSGIVVSLPEPTAILNAYEFLKNVVFRIFTKQFKDDPGMLDLIARFKTSGDTEKGNTIDVLAQLAGGANPDAERQMRQVLHDFRPALVLNMARKNAERLGRSLEDICATYLSIQLRYFGSVPYDERVPSATLEMKPFLWAYPDSSPSQSVRQIAQACMNVSWMDSAEAAGFSEAPAPDTAPGDGEGGTRALARTAGLAARLDGRSDVELSSLLSGFLKETSSLLVDEPRVAPIADSETIDGEYAPPDAEHFAINASAATINLPIEPRIRPDARLPYFAPVPEGSQKSAAPRGFFDRFRQETRMEADFSARLAEIRKAPRGKGVAVALQALMDDSPLSPYMGWDWLETGLAFVKSHQIHLAQQAFSRAATCLPKNDVAANNWAASLIAMGAIARVPTILEDALKNNPHSSFLYFNLGLAFLSMKQYKRAADCFSKVRAMFGGDDFLNVHFLEGYCLYQIPDYTAAELMFRSAAKSEPDDMYAQFNLGLSQIHRHMYDESVNTMTRLLNEAPDDAEAYAARGLAKWHSLDMRQALGDFTQAIRLEPAKLAFYVARASIAHQLGRYDLAIPDMQAITRLLPAQDSLQSLIGKIRQELEALPADAAETVD